MTFPVFSSRERTGSWVREAGLSTAGASGQEAGSRERASCSLGRKAPPPPARPQPCATRPSSLCPAPSWPPMGALAWKMKSQTLNSCLSLPGWTVLFPSTTYRFYVDLKRKKMVLKLVWFTHTIPRTIAFPPRGWVLKGGCVPL